MTCPTCGGPYDPVAKLAAMNLRRLQFEQQYPRIHCPKCRKRVSAKWNSIDACNDGPMVRMHCHHCDERFEVPRQKLRAARHLA